MTTNHGWQPIETAPRDKWVVVFREDAGEPFTAMLTSYQSFIDDGSVPDPLDQISEDERHDLDWWGCEPDGLVRLDGTLKPTHWHPLPPPPEERRDA